MRTQPPMRSLLLAISTVFFTMHTQAQQNGGWFASVQVGYGDVNLNGLHSNYTPYFEGYAKLPMSLPGYENPVLFTEVGPSRNASVLVAIESGKNITNRFNLSLRYTFYSMFENGTFYNEGGSNLNDNLMKTAQFLQTTHHAIVVKPSWRFNKLKKKGSWQLYLIGGTTYYQLNNGLRVQTEPSSPTTYLFGKHWGITAAAEVTTFNMKPDKIERYSYEINGEELVSTLPLREREILLGDDLVDYPDNPNIPQALPAENYRFIIPQITLGVVYAL
jgi:hypothetical protein